jgi:DNA-binding LacI/PurR family transcriptional regulator
VLALGAIEELTRRRQRVPEDVSVTGFDGIRQAIDAHLTTVVQPVVDKGRQAGRMLLNPERKTQGRRIMLETTFLPGRTTAPPRI